MKKPITLALSLLALMSAAQYNNTYNINGNGDNLTPAFVITNSNLESITVSYGSDGPTTPRTDYFIVTKLDASGGYIYSNRIFPNTTPKQGFTHVEALIQTDNKDVLIGGYFYKDAKHVEQPFIMKLDYSGNHLWTKIYPINGKPMPGSQFNKISFCRVADDADENYFMVANGDSDHDNGNGVAVNVLKVDVNGNPIFIKKYYESTGPSFTTIRDYAGDIEFSTKDNRYMITGRRLQANSTKLQNMFFFKIDNNGINDGPFLTVNTKSIPTDQDMVYDEINDIFAVTYTHAKDTYEPTTSSVMGFLTIKNSLAISNTKYIWHTPGDMHNSTSISLAKDGYSIGADIYIAGNTMIHNPSWLKVDYSCNAMTPLQRYNVDDNVIFGHHALTSDGSDDQFVLANEHKTDLRQIRTDANGKACGYESFDPIIKDHEVKTKEYEYKDEDKVDMFDYDPKIDSYQKDPRVCKYPGTSYRPANATGIAQIGSAENTTIVYPSIMSSDNARLTVVNNSSEAVKMEIHNIAGQLIYSDSKIASGTTEIQLNANGPLSEGLYIAKVYNTNGTTQITKILVTK